MGASSSKNEEAIRKDCVFCDQSQHNKVWENDQLYVIKDKYPDAEHHYLVIPKQHIPAISQLSRQHIPLVSEMKLIGKQFMSQTDPANPHTFGFHVPPFNSIDHLHLHCLSGKRKGMIGGVVAFMEGTPWFISVDMALQKLESKK